MCFDPEVTFESGQTFRWKRFVTKDEPSWIGVISNYVVRMRRGKAECVAKLKESDSNRSNFSDDIANYLSTNDDLNRIVQSFPRDEYLQNAVKSFDGLRVLTQDPWECLISFVCSINKNIPAIKMMLELLSMKFGSKIRSSNEVFYSFPKPSTLAKASKIDLLACKVGFRWRFIRFIANQVRSGKLDLKSVSQKSYGQARDELISELSGTTFGVGPKVADCVMLFSMHKMEAFPVDVWMLRCIQSIYSQKMGLQDILMDKKSLTRSTYDLVHKSAHEYFGRYCGYAQQYLYMKIRHDFIRNKALV
jgi:N-glycosylase/DNA lyase